MVFTFTNSGMGDLLSICFRGEAVCSLVFWHSLVSLVLSYCISYRLGKPQSGSAKWCFANHHQLFTYLVQSAILKCQSLLFNPTLIVISKVYSLAGKQIFNEEGITGILRVTKKLGVIWVYGRCIDLIWDVWEKASWRKRCLNWYLGPAEWCVG